MIMRLQLVGPKENNEDSGCQKHLGRNGCTRAVEKSGSLLRHTQPCERTAKNEHGDVQGTNFRQIG